MNYVICDLDSTLASNKWREELLRATNGKNFDRFHKAIPFDARIDSTYQTLLELEQQGLGIIYMSARPEWSRQLTVSWLRKYDCPSGNLVLRANKDSRNAVTVKKELYLKFLQGRNIVHCFDDKPAILEMWKEFGFETTLVVDPCLTPNIFKNSCF